MDLALIVRILLLFYFLISLGCRSTIALASLCLSILWKKWPFPHEGLF